ncbi:MAG: hypothetical protein IT436_06700 [Phycisphaerales bacterium]|nr:hypothetical protein [Phycisphaerales bacterium]
MKPGLPLSISIAGLPGEAETRAVDPRPRIEWAAGLGARFIQLDAALPGIRPRDLDRSARRDLAALLRRLELGLSGLDLWIPPAHFADPARADRAITALVQAVELAGDLTPLAATPGGRPTVSVSLPTNLAEDVRQQLISAAGLRGVAIADHSWPARAGADPASPIGIGVDPAAVILAGLDPAREVGTLASAPASARLCDLSPAGRVPPGEGSLDELSYTVALEVKGYRGPLVLDLRGLPRPQRTARDVLERWTGLGAGS